MTQSQQIRLLLATGKSVRDIARELNIRYQIVYQVYQQELRRAAAQINTDPTQSPPDDEETQQKQAAAKEYLKQIAKATSNREQRAQDRVERWQQSEAQRQWYRDQYSNQSASLTIESWLEAHGLHLETPMTDGVVERLLDASHQLANHTYSLGRRDVDKSDPTQGLRQSGLDSQGHPVIKVSLEELRRKVEGSKLLYGMPEDRLSEITKEAETNPGLRLVLGADDDNEPLLTDDFGN